MSCILGVVQKDASPPEPTQFRRMMAALARCGPDGVTTWCDDGVCLGNALFRTVEDVTPLGLASLAEAGLWITADARIDARDELRHKLDARGQKIPVNAPDELLVLHAYRAWDEACVEHLLGDFAFIIWDQRRRALFAARDHFGVKPLYYAQTDGALLVSNRVEAIRSHSGVSDELDEDAIADFLLFGSYQDTSRTIYAAIRALPPAHTLMWRPGSGEARVRCYWRLPTDGNIRYKDPNDYVFHFRELLARAVRDRMRSPRVSILMSGGLDSTAVAAMAHESGQASLRAFTLDSRHYPRKKREAFPARQAADYLGFPLTVIDADPYALFQGWEHPDWGMAQPVADPLWQLSVDLYRRMARHGPVALTGQGGDPALYPSRSYLMKQIKGFHWRELVNALHLYHRATGQWPPLYLRTHLSRGHSNQRQQIDPPAFDFWYQPDFAHRMRLPERWEAWRASIEDMADAPHPLRPEAYANLSAPLWPHLFVHTYGDVVSGAPLEFRHPYFDLRLITYVLALPPLPWFESKFIVRQALIGRIPESVRRRPKSALDRSMIDILKKKEKFDIFYFEKVIRYSQIILDRYLQFASLEKAAKAVQQLTQEEFERFAAALALIQWRYNLRQEV